MKIKIKVYEKTPGCMPEIFNVGDCIDLRTAEEYTFKCPHAKMLHKQKKEELPMERFRDVVFNYTLLDLGVIIELPEGYEGILIPRSSTFKRWGLIQTNSIGEIDLTYRGPNDVWRMPVLATRSITIPKGERICQFRIQLSQKATMWQKLKWLFSSGVEIERITELSHKESRGGIGEGTAKMDSSSEIARNNNKIQNPTC